MAVREDWVERLLHVALTLGASGLILGGCAHDHVRPDDMSASAHRERAQEEYAKADRDLMKYDPYARAYERAGSQRIASGDATYATYNPTDFYRTDAQKKTKHAQEHLAAAAELERFTHQACKPFSPTVKTACPVLGPVASVEDIGGGVRVHLQPGAPVDAVMAHMRCHLAYAREQGWQPAPDCPLYLRGVDIRRSDDGQAIELTAKDGKTIDELRRRAHAEQQAPSI